MKILNNLICFFKGHDWLVVRLKDDEEHIVAQCMRCQGYLNLNFFDQPYLSKSFPTRKIAEPKE